MVYSPNLFCPSLPVDVKLYRKKSKKISRLSSDSCLVTVGYRPSPLVCGVRTTRSLVVRAYILCVCSLFRNLCVTFLLAI